MTSRRRFLVLAGTVLAVCVTTGVQLVTPAPSLPARLSDREFWRLVTESSEPDGFFRSDNLLSNELGFQYVDPGAGADGRSPGGCTWVLAPNRTSPISSPRGRRWSSSSTSGAATSICI